MPIQDREDAAEVEAGIARVFGAPPEERAAAIRQLFVEALDFNPAQGQVSLANAPAGVELPDAADRVAALEGVHVLHIALEAPANGRVRKADVNAAARVIAEQIGDDLLLVVTNAGAGQLHLVRPDLGAVRPTLRRMVVERDLPQRTAVEQIAEIYWKRHETGSLTTALDRAFDVEPVTKRFFAEYRRVFERVEESVTGFGAGEDEQRRLFVQTLFNRLMFVYFLQRKGWLDFRGDKDYLNALWGDYQSKPAKANFYRERLHHLFFTGLNNPDSRDVTAGTEPLIGTVPFLNGGLFEQADLDRRDGVTVPDEAVEAVLTELFERFNFTVMESTPFDTEVAVDPEMLGKVFEELVTGRHESGSYYTPRQVVSFMCREALKGYLEGATDLNADPIRLLVDEHDASGISLAHAQAIAGALDEVTVVDPACGSGAYLLGMMQELVELWAILYSDRLKTDARSFYDLKLHIIERNLYGVDIDPFAVNIAMLRMWLSLAIEYEGDKPKPLPNLDLTIVTGDSLLAAHSADGGVQSALGDTTAELQELKSRYMRTSAGPAKASLRAQINDVSGELRERYGGSGAADAGKGVEWRSSFPEVFEAREGRAGGFDIIVANPPYQQLQRDGGRLGNLYRDAAYRTFARTGDIYQLFYERGCTLLKPNGGVLAYITSNSWLRAEYGKRLRSFFAERHTPLRWLDLGKDVFESAIVDSGVLLLRTGREATQDADRDTDDSEEVGRDQAFPAVDMDRLPGVGFPPDNSLWGAISPDGDTPWSILSLTEQSVMDKMRRRGTPLAEWNVSINYGVKTGYNGAFIIDDATRQALVTGDPKSAEVIKPVLRGRDIRPYQAEWAGKWLIATFPALHLDIDDYPAVRDHLRSFGQDRLEQSGKRLPNGGKSRKSTGHRWFETQDVIAYHNHFAKPKLFWMDMSLEGRFAYSEDTKFCNDKGFVMVGGPLKYLCALLNGSLITWMVRNIALTTGMGVPQWKKFAVERIPIPRVTERDQRRFVELVDRIIEAKAADAEADTEEWERAIDRLVYDLYGLTPEEDTAVERALGLIHPSDEAEDAAILHSMVERDGDAREFVSEDVVMAALRAQDGA